MKATASSLDQVRSLYDRGLYRQAYELGLKALGPLRKWTGADARVMAGRLAGNLGAPRLRLALFSLAWRSEPDHPVATYYMSSVVRQRGGLVEAWEWTSRRGDLPGARDALRADWLANRADLASEFRDFDLADRLYRQAVEIAPAEPWVRLEGAHVLLNQDRHEEALACCRKALELRPDYPPAVGTAASVLQMLGRDAEALDLLRTHARPGESTGLFTQLGLLEVEMGLLDDARADFQRALDAAALAEPVVASVLHSRLCDVAHLQGDAAAAARHAKESGRPGYAMYAERCAAAGPDARRVLLPVPFVQQHHVTCAPATLAAISRRWERPAEHLEVAEKICYDGTPSHSERRWAEENGWAVREFRVTWDAAKLLIDRGIPFTLALSGPRYGHLQAVAGYDGARRSLLIRDPSDRVLLEYEADAFLEATKSSGPRGMAMAPGDRKAELDALALPESAAYDRLHALLRALDANDRPAAQRELDALAAGDPNHRLAHRARMSLAAYDGDRTGHLERLDALLALYPDDEALIFHRLSALRDLARTDERIALLRERAERPFAYSGFMSALADELAEDARHIPEAERLLRRCLRRNPDDGQACESLARIYWVRDERERSAELLRFAASLRDKDEDVAMSYFLFCVGLRRAEEGLELLKSRHARYGRKSSGPARTLHAALGRLNRDAEAAEVLEKALRDHPEDALLRLYAAETAVSRGDVPAAKRLVEEARPRARAYDLLRTQAFVAAVDGDSAAALDRWREVALLNPTDVEAQSEIVRILTESGNRSAAEKHLDETLAKFPHHMGLHGTRVNWLQEDNPSGDEVERALRTMLTNNPRDGWALRELAVVLLRRGRIDEALAASSEALTVEPHSTWSHSTRSAVLKGAGRVAEQAEAARAAVKYFVGNTTAIRDLLDAQPDAAGRRAELKFVRNEIERQPHPGESIDLWTWRATDVMKADELLPELRAIQAARPDLWPAWISLVIFLAENGSKGEAVELGRKATERFPLVARVWLAHARACLLAGVAEGERESLGRALAMSPGFVEASHALALAHRRAGDSEGELAVLGAAIARSPLDAELHGAMARCHWRLGRKEKALAGAVRAVRLKPAFEAMWDEIRAWKPGEDLRVAAELTASRPDQAAAWVAYAKIPRPPSAIGEQLAALDKALAVEPAHFEALDLKVVFLAQAGRFDEAMEICRTPKLSGRALVAMKGRGWWIEGLRGPLDAAIKGMKGLVEEYPGYYWGWTVLYDWCRERDPALARRAASELVRIEPNDAFGWVRLAEAREGREGRDREGAKAAYRSAMNANPDWPDPVVRLIELHLKDSEFEPAEAAIERLRGPDNAGRRAERRVKVAMARHQIKKAAEILEEMAVLPDPGSLALGVEWMLEAGESRPAADALERAIETGAALPLAGWHWMRCTLRQARWGDAKLGLKKLASWPAVWDQAAACWLHTAREQGSRWGVRWFLFRNGEAARRGDQAWANAGSALMQFSFRRSVKWFSDWESRPGAEPWMLVNVALGLRTVGRDLEAGRVSRAALDRPPDHATHLHRVWLGFDEAVGGSAEAGRHELEAVDATEMKGYFRYLHEVGLAVVAARAGAGSRKDRFKEARRRMAGAGKVLKHGGALPAYRQAVRVIARERGGVIGVLWKAAMFVGSLK